jgi:CxxC motif-containing protein (DUF1111 family)
VRQPARAGIVLAVLSIVAGACSEPADVRSGGEATVEDTSGNAFAIAIPSLTTEQRRAFSVGNSFFNDNWVTAPASTEGRDGLGPLFNAQSCSSCHFKDGRASPPLDGEDPGLGLLLRIGVAGEDPMTGAPLGDPNYGDQLQDRSIGGVDAEGRIRIDHTDLEVERADGTTSVLSLPGYGIEDLAYGPLADDLLISPRIAPMVTGTGLLEAIPAETITEAADPDDEDGDGVSGRVNTVWDVAAGEPALGRFGWKANVPTVAQQGAAAFLGDIGITSPLFPGPGCTEVQGACLAAPHGGEPEVDQHKLDRIAFYVRTLAVPARRDPSDPNVRRGEELFAEIGCTACHTPTLETGPSDIDQLANQVIHPYTDLLLHDMGPDLADGRPDFDAAGSEWRTPPLWGIGLVETVNGHTRFMHDGRARSLEEAILWHGGEAERARLDFTELSDDDVDALLAFLLDL